MSEPLTSCRVDYLYHNNPDERVFRVGLPGQPDRVYATPTAQTPAAVAAYLDALNNLVKYLPSEQANTDGVREEGGIT